MNKPLLIIEEIKHGDVLAFSRHVDPTPVKCYNCPWTGQRKDTNHTYKPDGEGDVECVDLCPNCRSEI